MISEEMVTKQEEQDNFRIDLDNPTCEPCCVDECNNLPTFKTKISLDKKLIGETFICMSHYNLGHKYPSVLYSKSRILQEMFKPYL